MTLRLPDDLDAKLTERARRERRSKHELAIAAVPPWLATRLPAVQRVSAGIAPQPGSMAGRSSRKPRGTTSMYRSSRSACRTGFPSPDP
ncbi:CopG family ribbon-helix-helix protein [Streptomyces sp. TP-A0874]|uniref:CopG family ribbon-helix-helix protein n=1 Tax=Streptomyces sp. TP-A0874 TaxID=549819 RepID=UPI0035B50907